ncbi:MAG: thiamine pyrophosphate-requiring protein [Alphaproteobacteria bacterium]|nr:thiamine pyrophosphate-requiring protein [Alphaproteobacteria bacterium]
MGKQTIKADTTAEAYLTLLADRGVDYLFGNAGTDFASVIEALSKAQLGEAKAPTPVTVPHENVAVSMAHGYYLATGRPQAVMLHVTVGTANGVCGIMNAARERIPMLFSAGRTPITEDGSPGSRSIYIHWAQEMFDQAGMVRELVKWDYELRNLEQLETVVDRALTVAMSEPRGPVYLTLPREILAEAPGDFTFDSPTVRNASHAGVPNPNAIDQAADMLSKAKNPMIISSSFGQNPDDVAALEELAERFAIPVVCYRPRYVNLPTAHSMHVGFEPAERLATADIVLTLESDTPWIPSLHKISPETQVIQAGVDPLFANYPIRGFRSDLTLAGDPASTVRALSAAMTENADRISATRKEVAAQKAELAETHKALLERQSVGGPMEYPWVAHCIGQVMNEDDALVSESQLPVGFLGSRKAGTVFGTSPAGGLGWGNGAALGLQLGDRSRRVFNVAGDGSYMFGNPTPAHFVGTSMELPICTIILNNRMWGSVRKSTLGMHPDGAASRLNRSPLTALEPNPDFEKVVEANGGYGERVDNAEDLPGALERALKAVDVEKRQAVLNVQTSYDDAQALADAKR